MTSFNNYEYTQQKLEINVNTISKKMITKGYDAELATALYVSNLYIYLLQMLLYACQAYKMLRN